MGNEYSQNLSFKFRLEQDNYTNLATIQQIQQNNLEITSSAKIYAPGSFYSGKIKNLPTITQELVLLDLSNNALSTLSVLNVKILTLQDNLLKSFKSSSSNLRMLNISNNEIASLSLSCDSLIQLKAASNKLTKIDLSATPNVQILDLSDNNLKGISLEILPKLRILTLKNCNLTSISIPNSVEKLDLQRNQLGEFSYAGGGLVSVNLSMNKLKTLNLESENLQKLDVSDNENLRVFEFKMGQIECFNAQKTCFSDIKRFKDVQRLIWVNVSDSEVKNVRCLRRNQYVVLETDWAVQIKSLPMNQNSEIDARTLKVSQDYKLVGL